MTPFGTRVLPRLSRKLGSCRRCLAWLRPDSPNAQQFVMLRFGHHPSFHFHFPGSGMPSRLPRHDLRAPSCAGRLAQAWTRSLHQGVVGAKFTPALRSLTSCIIPATLTSLQIS